MLEQNFQKIKERYEYLEKGFLKQGRLLVKDTGVGFWGVSSTKDVFELFKKINLARFNHFLDLGSGDGRIALIASLFTKSTGIEADHELHMIAHSVRQDLNMQNAQLINDNFYNYDLSRHDIVFVSPDAPMFRGLEQKLLNELKGYLVVFGPHFHPTQLKKAREFFVNDTLVGIYSK